MKKKIIWLAGARSAYNDFLFGEVSKKYELVVVYHQSDLHKHPCKFKNASYKYILIKEKLLKVWHLCRESDLLILAGWGFWRYLLLASFFFNKKRVYWTDTLPVPIYFYGCKGVVRRLTSTYVFNTFTQIWSTGISGCRALMEAGCPPEKIRDFPYFVDLDRLGSELNKNEILAKKFREKHADSNSIVFLAMGQFILRKRYCDILNAISKIKDKHFVFWLAGNGPQEGQLRSQVNQLGLQSRVSFLGWIQSQNIDVVYLASDVFIHPAEYEPFGVVVLDAMAMGKPVIGARSVGAVVDRVQHMVNGYVYTPGEVEELAQAINYFLMNPLAIKEYGLKARETAEQYPVEKGLSILDEVFCAPPR